MTVLYDGWTARVEEGEAVLQPGPVAALAALLDDGLAAPAPGEPLPLLWHWAALAGWAPATGIGPDGHPSRGGFLPPVPAPRRMFAGGTVTVHAPLLVGQQVRFRRAVTAVEEKQGRSGPFVVVTVEQQVGGASGEAALVEQQQLVFRDQVVPGAEAQTRVPAAVVPCGSPLAATGGGAWDLGTDPVTLMRFSAATANTHRIHYDWPYATAVEGYPGLVVQGPLLAVALAEVLRLQGRDVRRFSFRAQSPLFCGEPAQLRREGTEEASSLSVVRPGGQVLMSAEASHAV